jgi:hypothetical protein
LQKTDFTRNRSLTFVNLIVFIINFIKRSTQIELYGFANFFAIPSVTKQAFSKARKKLSPIVFTLLNQKLLEEFYSDNTINLFKGFRVLAIDGSSLRLPQDDALFNQYGGEEQQSSVPLAKISNMHDVLNNITLHGVINNYKSSERDLAIQHIEYLAHINQPGQAFDDLLMFDRGYPSLTLLLKLYAQKKHFIMRITHSFVSETNIAIKAEKIDSSITIEAFPKNKKFNPVDKEFISQFPKDLKLQLRLLIFDLGNGKKEYILTSLLDQSQFTYNDIFILYGKRWGIEESYKFYKNIVQIENFSGKSKIAVEQEFFGAIFAGNISSLLSLEAEKELEEERLKTVNSEKTKSLKYQYKANRNILIGIIKDEIMGILCSNEDLNEYCDKLKNRIKKNLVPIIPGRQFSRFTKRTRNKFRRRVL